MRRRVKCFTWLVFLLIPALTGLGCSRKPPASGRSPGSPSSAGVPSSTSTTTSSGGETTGSPAKDAGGSSSGSDAGASTASAGGSAGNRQSNSADSDSSGKQAEAQGGAPTGQDGSGNSAGAAMIPTGAASTPEERQAGLDGEFQESLEAFDEKLLREQQGAASKRVDQEEAAALEAESSAMGFGGSFGEKPDGSEMEEGVAGGAKGGDDKTSGNRGAVPSDVRSTSGDDIVARQLREAAMKEKDPELREKLWNEYRKYKGIPVKSAPAAKEDSGETRSPAEQATDDSGDSEGSENR